jgi:hypothetical protein
MKKNLSFEIEKKKLILILIILIIVLMLAKLIFGKLAKG